MRLNPEKLSIIWNRIIDRYSLPIIFIIPILAVITLFYTVNNLGMNTDTRDMLSAELSWRKLDIEYEKLFPHATDNLIIVIEAATPDEAMDSALTFENKLKQHQEFFKTIYYPKNEDFIKTSSLLYMDINQLQDLADTLAKNQPFLSRLMRDQSLNGFLTMLHDAVEAKQQGEEIDLSTIFHEFNNVLNAHNHKKHYQMSWQNLLSAEQDKKKVYKEFIIVQPILDFTNFLPAENVLNKIRELAVESGITPKNNMQLKLTGTVALSHEELVSVSNTNLTAIIIAFILVAFILVFGLGSGKLVLLVLGSLMTGLIFTAGFATFAIGELNLISVVFAVLYIGLGVDFGIHYCLKYRELIIRGENKKNAIDKTNSDIGTSLLLCAFTTAIGFYAFVPTDYNGISELGLISGTGMFISLFITLTFLPALLKHANIMFEDHPKTDINPKIISLLSIPERHSSSILIFTILITAISLWCARDLRFENSLLNIQPQNNESVVTFKELFNNQEYTPLTNILITENENRAEELSEQLIQLPLVKDVIWLNSFIPEEQEDKLFIIDEINLLQGELFTQKNTLHVSPDITLDTLNSFKSLLISITNSDNIIASNIQNNITVFQKNLSQLNGKQTKEKLDSLERSLLASLPGRMNNLNSSLNTEGLSLSDINDTFSRRWKGNNNYLLEIIPTEDLSNYSNLEAFVEQTQIAAPQITGPPVVSVEASKAVVNAFKQGFLSAFIAITILLLILMPKIRYSFFVIIPLLIATILTSATSVLFNVPLNLANIIALPLLFGIGVDSAIHIIHRHHEKQNKEILLASSSARAIVISALTTIFSIGNLAFSPHLGTASMGILLTIGISFALLCTLIITPALLASRD